MNPSHIPEASQEKAAQESMYFQKLADTYRIVKIITALFLVIFLLLAILWGSGSMRVTTIRYLFKYIASDPTASADEPLSFPYATGSSARFALFHDDLAVMSEGKMTLYSGGDIVFRENIETGNASFALSDLYLAVHVSGKYTLSLFHSFGKIDEISFSSPISRVAVSDHGELAVQTAEGIRILNEKQEEKATITPSGVVMDMALSRDGRKLLVLSLSGGSSYRTVLELFDTASSEVIYTETFLGKKPVSSAFFDDGRFFLALDGSLVFYSGNGSKKGTVSLPMTSCKLHADANSLLIYSPAGEVTYYDSNGTCTAMFQAEGVLRAGKTADGNFCLYTQDTLTLYDKTGTVLSTTTIKDSVLDFFLLRDGSILLCSLSEAKQIFMRR